MFQFLQRSTAIQFIIIKLIHAVTFTFLFITDLNMSCKIPTRMAHPDFKIRLCWVI